MEFYDQELLGFKKKNFKLLFNFDNIDKVAHD